MSETTETGDLTRLRSDRLALALLVLAALVRASILGQVWANDLELRGHVNIDAYNFHRRAARIAAGDWAARERFDFSGIYPDEPGHPRFSFPIAVLGLERYDSEFGPSTYFDYPGYAYFIAPFYAVFGTGTRSVLVAQEALDLLACALVYLIALRIYDRSVARVALALTALFGPLAFDAAFLLRDSLIASLYVVVVYLAVRARDTKGWLATGVAVGLAWTVKGGAIALVPFLLPRARLRGGAALALGAALAVAPLALRNMALGVPPLRASTLEEASLIFHNVPQASLRGLDLTPLERARAVAAGCEPLTKANALRAAIRAHPSPASFVAQSARRVREHYRADDAWDNVRYSWLAPYLESLWLAPVRWKLIEPFAAIGLILVLGDPRRRAVLLGPVAENVTMAALGMALERYRLHAEAIHCLLAASAIVWLIREARRRKAHALWAALGGVAVTVALHDPVTPPPRERVFGYVAGTFGVETARRLIGLP